MDSGSERRARLRVVVGPEVTIRFQVKQFAYLNVRITNLSMGGCFATLPRTEPHLFSKGTLLEHFQFEDPNLSGEAFLAKVTYVLGAEGGGPSGGRGGLSIIGLGIQFVSPSAATEAALERYIDTRQ